MKKYTVYFEIFGHKLKHTTYADNEDAARKKIKDKIIFHKVEQEGGFDINNLERLFDDIFK